MTTIGQTLAAAREDLGYSLADLSARTCIRQPVLAGMEGDDFRVCGGDFYARGHIRSVCRELGLDPGPLIEEFDREHARGSMAPAFTGAPVTTGTVHPTGRSSAAGDAAEERAKEGARERAEERAAPAAEAPTAAPQAAVPAPRGPRDTEAAVAASGAGRARRGAAGGDGGAAEPGAAPHPAPARAAGSAAPRPDSAGPAEAGAPAAEDAPRRRRGGRILALPAAVAAAARRSWPLLVVAALAGAAIFAAVRAWPDEDSRERAAGAVVARPGGQAAAAQGRAGGLSAVVAAERKAEEVRLTLAATDRVWVRVTGPDGRDHFTGIMERGHVRTFAHPDELRLHAGRASALHVRVNGEDRGPLGDTGRVADVRYAAVDLV